MWAALQIFEQFCPKSRNANSLVAEPEKILTQNDHSRSFKVIYFGVRGVYNTDSGLVFSPQYLAHLLKFLQIFLHSTLLLPRGYRFPYTMQGFCPPPHLGVSPQNENFLDRFVTSYSAISFRVLLHNSPKGRPLSSPVILLKSSNLTSRNLDFSIFSIFAKCDNLGNV